MSGVFSDNEVAEGLRQPGRPAKPPLEDHSVVVLATLGNIERELRRIRSLSGDHGRQFSVSDGGQATAGGIFVQRFEGPRSGNDWYVERVTVSAAGASAAGTISLYEQSSQGALGQAQDESQLLDYLAALAGNAPSRGVLDGRGVPYFIYGGLGLTVVVAGVVATTPVFVRLQGRETQGGTDPGLRDPQTR